MLSQIEYILGLVGIFLLGIDKIALAAIPITICAIIHLRIRKNPHDNIIEVADELYSKNGSATITLDKLSKEFKQMEKEFKRYWLGLGGISSYNETKAGLILANSAISGESASTALRLAKGEERMKEYKNYATAKAKGMYVLTWLGLSFFFPFFSGVGLSIITGSSILANASGNGIVSFFSTAVSAYIFELMLISNAFYNIEKSFWYALLDSIFPFSIALLVLKASSHIFAIL